MVSVPSHFFSHCIHQSHTKPTTILDSFVMAEAQQKVVCEACDKTTQKELPQVSTSSQGMPCEKAYLAVSECMANHKGQISSCVKEWDAFRECHENKKHRS